MIKDDTEEMMSHEMEESLNNSEKIMPHTGLNKESNTEQKKVLLTLINDQKSTIRILESKIRKTEIRQEELTQSLLKKVRDSESEILANKYILANLTGDLEMGRQKLLNMELAMQKLMPVEHTLNKDFIGFDKRMISKVDRMLMAAPDIGEKGLSEPAVYSYSSDGNLEIRAGWESEECFDLHDVSKIFDCEFDQDSRTKQNLEGSHLQEVCFMDSSEEEKDSGTASEVEGKPEPIHWKRQTVRSKPARDRHLQSREKTVLLSSIQFSDSREKKRTGYFPKLIPSSDSSDEENDSGTASEVEGKPEPSHWKRSVLRSRSARDLPLESCGKLNPLSVSKIPVPTKRKTTGNEVKNGSKSFLFSQDETHPLFTLEGLYDNNVPLFPFDLSSDSSEREIETGSDSELEESASKHQQSYVGHLYKFSWNGYPRVNAFLQHFNNLHDRCKGIMDTYSKLTDEVPVYNFVMEDEVNSLMEDPHILVFGELNDRLTVDTLVRNAKVLGRNYSQKTVNIWDWRVHIETRRTLSSNGVPVIAVLTAKLVNERDFKKCERKLRQNLRRLLFMPRYQRQFSTKYATHRILAILCVIENGTNIFQETSPKLQSFCNNLGEFPRPYEIQIEVVIVDVQNPKDATTLLLRDKVSNKVSDQLERRVVSSLRLLADISKINLWHRIQSYFPYDNSKVNRKIEQDLVNLLDSDEWIARTILCKFKDKLETLSTVALVDCLHQTLIQAVQTRLEELSSSFGIQEALIKNVIRVAKFQYMCQESIQSSTDHKLLEIIRMGLIGYLCRNVRDKEEREVFQTLLDVNENKKYIALFMKDVNVAIESTLQRIALVEEHLSVQEKIHFQTISVLRRTIAKDEFTTLMEEVKLPTEDLLSIDGVKGFGIIYNKLHIHIEQRDEESDEKLRNEIQTKLTDYPHPYEIGVIIQKPKSLFSVGQKIIAASSRNWVKSIYGTVGGFLKDPFDDLYLLTAGHVVAFAAVPSDVYLSMDSDTEDAGYEAIGTKIYVPVTDNSGEQGSQGTDIAAVKIKESQRGNCDVRFKRPNGSPGPCYISQGSLKDVDGRNVYKWGASTGLTTGNIGSANYIYKEDLPQCHVFIESSEETQESKLFADGGDSGATVCAVDEDDECRISVIAMVRGGNMELRGNSGRKTNVVLASYVHEGIKALGLELSPCEYQIDDTVQIDKTTTASHKVCCSRIANNEHKGRKHIRQCLIL